MTQAASPNTFRPWISNLINSFYGAVAIWLSFHFLFQRGRTGEFVIALALCSGFTVYQWKQFARRWYGQRVEKKALKALTKAIGRLKSASIVAGVMLKSGGDADAVVAIPGLTLNIEIKSIQSPQKVTSKHAAQTRRAADELFTIPLIWLPRAPLREIRAKNDVRIFAGDAKALVKYMESMK